MTGHYGFVSRVSQPCWACQVDQLRNSAAQKFDQVIWVWVSLGWLSACKVYIPTSSTRGLMRFD